MNKFLQNLKSLKNLMQIFNYSNLSCQAIGSVTPIVKSRTNSYLPVFTMLLMLILGGWNSEVLAAWSGSGSGTLKNGVWYVLYETGQTDLNIYEEKTKNLSGPGAQLTFDAKRQPAGTGNLTVTDNTGHQYYRGNPGHKTKTFWGVESATDFDSYGPYAISNVSTVTSLTFTGGITLHKYVKNIKVTMAQYLENPSESSLNFGEADINSDDATMTFTVAWCNLPAMTYPITGTDKDLFSVSVANNSAVGKYNTATFTVKYKHTTAGSHSATLTIKDGNGNNTKTVTLSGTTNKLQPTVTWSPDDAMFNVDDVLSATNNNNLTVTLSGDANYVSCSGNTATMLAATPGTITITAHVTGDNIYADRDITKDITITNLEKQYITWTQDFSRLKTTDASKSIVLNATASSGLPVTYELVGDKTGLTLTQSGNTWTLTYSATECKNTTIVASQGGNGTYAPASSVSLPVKVIDPTKVCDMNEVLINSSISLKAENLWTPASVTYNIDIPASMTVSFSRMKTGLFDAYLYGVDVEFYNGRNGTGDLLYTKEYSASNISNSLSNDNINLSSYINAKSVKITTSATNGYYINAVSYAHRKYCTLSANTVAFETFPNTETSAKTFKVNYANYPVYLECSNPKFTFTPTEFGDCSEYGTQEISVKYTAGNDEGEDVGYLYVKDNTGVTLQTCTLTVVISKVSQSITSTNIQSSYWTTDKVTLSAEANSELTDFTYSASPAGIATIAGSEMIFSQSGTIAITVNQAGNNIYRSTSTTVSNVEVKKSTPDIATAPTGTSIVYLQTLNKSTLSGGAADITLRGVAHTHVTGSFAWTEPTHVVMDAAGSHSYSVTFTPTDGGMYTTKELTIPITILRAEQSLSMNNGTVKVAVDGIDAGAADSKIDLDGLIASQTGDVVNNVKRDGNVSYEVISANKGNATIGEGNIFSATVCGTYTIRATKAQTDYYNVVTKDFTVTVEKRSNTLATAADYTKYVDEVVTNVATTVNSDGDIHTESSDGTIAYYDVAQNKIFIPNNEAKSFNSTTVTIKIWQDATDRFEACAEKTITLTVKKYSTNELVCSWGGWSKEMNFDEQVKVTFSCTKDNEKPIVVSNPSNAKIARYNSETDSIYSSYNRGTVTWTVSQVENYKYQATTPKTLTVKVDTIPNPNDCLVLNKQEEYSLSGVSSGPIFTLDAPGDSLYFDAKKEKLLSTGKIYGQYSVDEEGDSFNNIGAIEGFFTLQWTGWNTIGVSLPAGTKRIRFVTLAGSDGNEKYYRNIRVTRKKDFKIVNSSDAEISTLEMPLNVVAAPGKPANSSTEKFYIDYNICDDIIKVVSNHPHFTIKDEDKAFDVSATEGRGRKEIEVIYTSATAETATATITVYTKYTHKTLTVTAVTDKGTQTLTWADEYLTEPIILPIGYSTYEAATASSELPVTYSIQEGEETIISIAENGYSFTVVGQGTAHLTATQVGNESLYSVSGTKVIHATEQDVQVIRWFQDLSGTLTKGDSVRLLAEVYVLNKTTNEFEKNIEQTQKIQYSCATNNVVEIVGIDNDTLHVLEYGTARVTATLPSDPRYVDVSPYSKLVEVIEPSNDCPDPMLVNYDGQLDLFTMIPNLNSLDDENNITTDEYHSDPFEFDRTNGKRPDKLSFQYSGEEFVINLGLIVKRWFSGYIKVQQRIDGQWSLVNGSRVQTEKNTWNKLEDLQIDENADAIRFVREANGTGHHYVTDINVSMLSYLRTDHMVVDLGSVMVGLVRDTTLHIEYANIKGELNAEIGRKENILSLGVNTIYRPCGSVGQYEWPIHFAPTEVGLWENTVVFTDPAAGRDLTITLRADVQPGYVYHFTTEGEWGTSSNWKEKALPGEEDIVSIESDVTIPYNDTVKVGQLIINPDVTVHVDGVLIVNQKTEPNKEFYGNLHVLKRGIVDLTNITAPGELIVNDFILDAALGSYRESGSIASASSGQIEGAKDRLEINGDAYFQLTLDPSGTMTYGWYDFVLPFEVDVIGGISVVENTSNIPLEFNKNYAVMDYSQEKRAENGKYWNKFRGTMLPGRAYTITLDDIYLTWNTVLFKKKAGASITDNRSYQTECSNTGIAEDCGWNGFGNGSLQHAELDVDENQKILIYDHAKMTFHEHEAKDYTIAIGTSFFMQFGSVQTVKLLAATGNDKFLAPARDGRSTEEFRLALTADGADNAADRLWVSASEEATGEYMIGHDLLKMGNPTEAKLARMWTVSNNNRLCDIELPLANNAAHCDLYLFAPQARTYSLAVEKAPQDVVLYLTYNDRPIWNLTMSPYEFDLEQGTTEGYGLQLYVRQAPEVATGVDGVQDAEIGARKVLINDKIYLITPEGAIFSVTGKKIQ